MGPGLLGPARPGSGSVVPDSAGPGFAGSAGLGRAKAAIARAGARLVRPAQAVGILAGRTTMLLTWELLAVPGLTVVTNAIEVADAFHHDGLDDQTVVLLGGVRSRTGALTGPVAERTAAGLNLDVVFLSVYGMAVRSGFTTPDRAEARTSAALIAAARRVVVLADHGKWGVRSAAVIAPLDGADVLVTDPGLTAPARATLRRQVGDLIIADPP
jgi:DeoR/GlpR family transcriptional regulator of sugar metabolism